LGGDVFHTFEAGSKICTAILKDVPPEIMEGMENHSLTTALRFSENSTFDFFGNRVTLPTLITDVNNFELNLFSSTQARDRGALYCVVYAGSDTRTVQYLAPDESYILHAI